MPASVSPIEIAWSAVALVGLCVNAWGLRDAYGDRAALRSTSMNGARLLVAWGNIRREWIRVFKQAIFLTIGGFALAAPPANPDRPVTVAGAVLAAGLIAAVLAMVAGSLLDRRERHRVLAYIDRELTTRKGIE